MRVGILGGGQLAQMLALAGIPLGIDFVCIESQANCPASKVAQIIPAHYDDLAAINQLAASVDVLTFESENIPAHVLQAISKPLYPSIQALEISQDRLTEKQFFKQQGIPVAEFMPVNEQADVNDAIEKLGLPFLIKTRREGYDGKGQRLIRSVEEGYLAFNELSPNPLIAEKLIQFDTEVSMIAVRDQTGQINFYPLTENLHHQGILHSSKAPFLNDALNTSARTYIKNILETLRYVGVLTIEFFVQGDGLIANEMAPRVHNSGHWTIEGAVTSQFENHLRAILGLPLGETNTVGYSTMVNFIGECPSLSTLLETPGLHVHFYGKEARPGRKLGHATLLGSPLPLGERQG